MGEGGGWGMKSERYAGVNPYRTTIPLKSLDFILDAMEKN